MRREVEKYKDFREYAALDFQQRVSVLDRAEGEIKNVTSQNLVPIFTGAGGGLWKALEQMGVYADEV